MKDQLLKQIVLGSLLVLIAACGSDDKSKSEAQPSGGNATSGDAPSSAPSSGESSNGTATCRINITPSVLSYSIDEDDKLSLSRTDVDGIKEKVILERVSGENGKIFGAWQALKTGLVSILARFTFEENQILVSNTCSYQARSVTIQASVKAKVSADKIEFLEAKKVEQTF